MKCPAVHTGNVHEVNVALVGVEAERSMVNDGLRDQEDLFWVRLRVPYPSTLEKKKNGKCAGEDKNNVPSLHAEF
jgi:hypothetical protein